MCARVRVCVRVCVRVRVRVRVSAFFTQRLKAESDSRVSGVCVTARHSRRRQSESPKSMQAAIRIQLALVRLWSAATAVCDQALVDRRSLSSAATAGYG